MNTYCSVSIAYFQKINSNFVVMEIKINRIEIKYPFQCGSYTNISSLNVHKLGMAKIDDEIFNHDDDYKWIIYTIRALFSSNENKGSN